MLTQKELKKRLHYNPQNGIFKWINISKYHLEKQNKIAGSIQPNKGRNYIVIGLNGKIYRAHRLAFLYMTGRFPKIIDHINGDGADNRWVNIVECDYFKNTQNHIKNKNGSGLPCGVRSQKSGNFLARITSYKKIYSLGSYKTPEEASVAYEFAKRKLHYCPARTL